MKHRIVLPVVLALIASAAALPASADLHYQATTRAEGQGAEAGSFRVDGWVSGEKARIEFIESGAPLMEKGSYLLTQDGGKNLFLVDPEERTYSRWDLEGMLGVATAMLKGMGGMFKLEFADPKVEPLGSEAGGSILGRPTTHHRYRTSYTLKMAIMGMKQETFVVTEQDIWATGELQDAALGVWLTKAPRTGIEGLDELLRAEMEKVQGFPLKSVSVTTSRNKKGKESVTRQTTEVTLLDQGSAPAGSYEIPAGYREVEMMPTASQGQQEGSGSPLRGLFGGKKKKDDGR